MTGHITSRYYSNLRQLFTDFVNSPTTLSGVTSTGISPGGGTVTLILVLENGQAGAQICLKHVLYTSQSPPNLINLHKLNKIRLYWDNRTWHLWDDKKQGQIIGYILKWRKSWIFQLLDTNVQDITIGITVIDDQTYQWPLEKKQSHYTLAVINLSDPLTLWHKRMGYLAINSLRKYLLCLGVSYTDDIIAKYYCDTGQLAKAIK